MSIKTVKSGLNGFASGLLIGGLIGAVTALWLAPQSGKKTQQMIGRRMHRLQNEVDDAGHDIRNSVEHASKEIHEKAADARHDSQEWLDHQIDAAGKSATKARDAVLH